MSVDKQHQCERIAELCSEVDTLRKKAAGMLRRGIDYSRVRPVLQRLKSLTAELEELGYCD